MHLLMLSMMLWSARGTFGPASALPAAAAPEVGPANEPDQGQTVSLDPYSFIVIGRRLMRP